MAAASSKWLVFRVAALASALFITIIASYVIRGGTIAELFGWESKEALNQEVALDWCEGEIDYVKISDPQEPKLVTLELTENDIEDFCSLQVSGYQPDAIEEKDFLPRVLIRYTNGAQVVFEADQKGHFRYQGMIFTSEELSRWLEER